MIPEEDPVAVEAEVRRAIDAAAAGVAGIRVEVRRLLLAESWRPDAANAPLVAALRSATPRPSSARRSRRAGTPLYTDVRLYAAAGAAAAIYGAGPRTVLESNAKRADEHLVLADLRGATKVVGRTLFDLLR